MPKSSSVFQALTSVLRHPPEAWLPGRMMALRAMRPVETFIHTEAAGGITLIAAALVAIVWANSPWHHSYEALWHTTFTVGLGNAVFTQDLHFWINEFAMTMFFLVIGLEVKREIIAGTLSNVRRAAQWIAADPIVNCVDIVAKRLAPRMAIGRVEFRPERQPVHGPVLQGRSQVLVVSFMILAADGMHRHPFVLDQRHRHIVLGRKRV